jgi:methyl-accepting chemotaxis protein
MAQAFNLTAQLNLRGPANIKNIVADIKRQLGTVQGTVNFTIDPKTTRNVGQLESALRTLNSTFAQTQTSATSAANAIRTFNSAVGNISSSTNNVNRSINAAANATQNLGKHGNIFAPVPSVFCLHACRQAPPVFHRRQ